MYLCKEDDRLIDLAKLYILFPIQKQIAEEWIDRLHKSKLLVFWNL